MTKTITVEFYKNQLHIEFLKLNSIAYVDLETLCSVFIVLNELIVDSEVLNFINAINIKMYHKPFINIYKSLSITKLTEHYSKLPFKKLIHESFKDIQFNSQFKPMTILEFAKKYINNEIQVIWKYKNNYVCDMRVLFKLLYKYMSAISRYNEIRAYKEDVEKWYKLWEECNGKENVEEVNFAILYNKQCIINEELEAKYDVIVEELEELKIKNKELEAKVESLQFKLLKYEPK